MPLALLLDATVALPGSKSITNRALACAALAEGKSTLRQVLFADDTQAMIEAIGALGVSVELDEDRHEVVVHGRGPLLQPIVETLNANQSGTTARFVVPLASHATAPVVVDAHRQLRDRPMGDQFGALRSLGVEIKELGVEGHLPAMVTGPMTKGQVTVAGDTSSQFISGLMLAGGATALDITLGTAPVSRPYIDMTANVMRSFGARVDEHPGDTWSVGGGYVGCDYEIEPDASAASYFLAAAAITGGRVRVEGLGRASLQGDMAFVDVLEAMGCAVGWGDDWVEVSGRAVRGVGVDLSAFSDTAPTLAAVAAFATTPTRVSGIGFIRAKESDRIAAIVTELNRCGVEARETGDGFVVDPQGRPHGTVFETYDDHRMAMAFSLIGLVVDGIEIKNPSCVNKTFPRFFSVLDGLRTPSAVSVIAIDGPAGSGKSSVARVLAAQLGLKYLDTGAMYRSVAWVLLQAGQDPSDGPTAAAAAQAIEIDIGREKVLVDGVDATAAIRSPEVNRAVSVVAANPEVRRELVRRQRAWAQVQGGGVLEGRDIGTVVFPNAALKVYLTADPSERARRRASEDPSLDEATVAADLTRRDTIDSTRAADPLTEANDAILVDTTGLTIDEVVASLVDRFQARTENK